MFFQFALYPLVTFIVTCMVLPWLALTFPVICVYCYLVTRFCLPTIRDMKRLEARARSPAYTHLSETITGIITIRTFEESQAFLQDFYDFQDNHTSCTYILRQAGRCHILYLSLIGNVYLIAMMFTLLALSDGEY